MNSESNVVIAIDQLDKTVYIISKKYSEHQAVWNINGCTVTHKLYPNICGIMLPPRSNSGADFITKSISMLFKHVRFNVGYGYKDLYCIHDKEVA